MNTFSKANNVKEIAEQTESMTRFLCLQSWIQAWEPEQKQQMTTAMPDTMQITMTVSEIIMAIRMSTLQPNQSLFLTTHPQ